MNDVVVSAHRLRRVFPQPRGDDVVAVDGASFEVRSGEVFGLLGPNGAGKTTTLLMLATVLPPSGGHATVAGFDVVRASLDVRRNLGYLSATSGLPPRLTARECLLTFARLQGVDEPRAAVDDALTRFAVRPFADRFVEGLSTGMRQRLRIACAAVHDPPVLILDEPTSGLDVIAAHDLHGEIRGLRDDDVAVLFSTHVMSEAEQLCDRVAILHEGRIRAIDTPAALMRQTGTDRMEAAFLALVGR